MSRLVRSPYAVGALGALLIMVFAFLNGYALLYFDTRSYVRGPALAIEATTGRNLAPGWKGHPSDSATPSKRVATSHPATKPPHQPFTASRSVYYGFLALGGYLSSHFWLTIALQALAIAVPWAILSMRVLRVPWAPYLVITGVLALTTSLGPVTALIMPDVFAPSMLLSLAALFGAWERLRRLDIAILAICIAYAALCHTSHIAILAAMTVAMALASWVLRAPRHRFSAVGVAAACLVISFAGQVTFNYTATRLSGEKPLLLPHLTAHLQDMGPGTQFLRANCPKVGFAACKYVDRLPMNWERFLFDDTTSGAFANADLATKRELSGEQTALAVDVLKYDPAGVVGGAIRDASLQLVRFSLNDLQISPAMLQAYRETWPSAVIDRLAGSRVGRSPALLNVLTLSTYALAIGGLLAIIVFAVVRTTFERSANYAVFLRAGGLLASGVVINAVVCGALASPYDRFQTRVIWLIPLLAMLWAVLRWRRSSAADVKNEAGASAGS